MKIAIKFGDNDFYNCWFGVLQTLSNAYKHTQKLPRREQLCKIINEISYCHYLLYQNQFKYNKEADGKFHYHTKDYLQITEKQLLINEEVDNYLEKIDWDNEETFILDTNTSNIYSI